MRTGDDSGTEAMLWEEPYGRVTTSYGPEGSTNFTPLAEFTARVAGISSVESCTVLVQNPIAVVVAASVEIAAGDYVVGYRFTVAIAIDQYRWRKLGR